MYSYSPSIDAGSVDFAGENGGGIYLDAQLCEFKLRVVKYKFLEEIAQPFACAMGVSFCASRNRSTMDGRVDEESHCFKSRVA